MGKQGKAFQVVGPRPRVAKIVDGWASGHGGRKTANAVVRIRKSAEGEGLLRINGRPLHAYFPLYAARELVLEPLLVTESLLEYEVEARVNGGGKSAQAGAVRLALGRALQNFDPAYRWPLKLSGCLTRDSRIVERKKTGKPKARRSKQW